MAWGDYATAAEMRDTIAHVARKVINKERPKPRFGYVSTIDRENFQATVIYEDERNEIGSSPQPVSMNSVQPLEAGVRVQITGGIADRQITAVYGPVYLADGSSSGSGGGGSGTHPDLTTHNNMGLATDSEVGNAILTHEDEKHPPSISTHPDVSSHDSMGLATDTELTAAITNHLATAPHGGGSGGLGASATDFFAWMPLTTVVGGTPELVWDADNNLIPTIVEL